MRLVHLVLLVLETGQSREQRSAAMHLVPSLLAGPCLVLIAAFLDAPYRELVWILAALIDLGGPLVVGVGGLRVLPRYFVDRHGLIIIIALGESIALVGTGAEGDLSQPGVLAAVVLAVLIAGQLWWSYFGLADAAQARLLSTPAEERTRLARDAYSYLHLLIVAGIVFFALGVHVAIDNVVDPLHLLPAVALTGGVALAYAGDVAYRWRDHHRLATDRLAAAAASAPSSFPRCSHRLCSPSPYWWASVRRASYGRPDTTPRAQPNPKRSEYTPLLSRETVPVAEPLTEMA